MKVSKLLLTPLIFLLIHQAPAQIEKEIFLDKSEFITDSVSAVYKRIIVENESQLNFKDYRITDGSLYQEGQLSRDTVDGPLFIEQSIRLLKQEICTVYYPNGQKKSSGPYSNNFKDGLFHNWYNNGLKEGEFIHRSYGKDDIPEIQPVLVMAFYDSLGNQLVKEGSGIYHETLNNGDETGSGPIEDGLKHGLWKGQYSYESSPITYEETYNHGEFVEGSSTTSDGTVLTYDEKSIVPKYKGGISNFYKFISKKMKYPKSARRQGIQGRVYVQFVVDKKGNTTDVKVVKGIGPKCDLEALEAVESADYFTPGLVRGRPVQVRMMMPIIFNLNN